MGLCTTAAAYIDTATDMLFLVSLNQVLKRLLSSPVLPWSHVEVRGSDFSKDRAHLHLSIYPFS